MKVANIYRKTCVQQKLVKYKNMSSSLQLLWDFTYFIFCIRRNLSHVKTKWEMTKNRIIKNRFYLSAQNFGKLHTNIMSIIRTIFLRLFFHPHICLIWKKMPKFKMFRLSLIKELKWLNTSEKEKCCEFESCACWAGDETVNLN